MVATFPPWNLSKEKLLNDNKTGTTRINGQNDIRRTLTNDLKRKQKSCFGLHRYAYKNSSAI